MTAVNKIKIRPVYQGTKLLPSASPQAKGLHSPLHKLSKTVGARNKLLSYGTALAGTTISYAYHSFLTFKAEALSDFVFNVSSQLLELSTYHPLAAVIATTVVPLWIARKILIHRWARKATDQINALPTMPADRIEKTRGDITQVLNHFSAGNRPQNMAYNLVWKGASEEAKEALSISRVKEELAIRPAVTEVAAPEKAPDPKADVAKIIELLRGNEAAKIEGMRHLLSLGEIGSREILDSAVMMLKGLPRDHQGSLLIAPKEINLDFARIIEALKETAKEYEEISWAVNVALALTKEIQSEIQQNRIRNEQINALIAFFQFLSPYSLHGKGKYIELEPDQLAQIKGVLQGLTKPGIRKEIQEMADACLFLLEEAEKEAPKGAAPAGGAEAGAAKAKPAVAPATGGKPGA